MNLLEVPSNIRLVGRGLGGLSMGLELKLQLFNQLGHALFSERVGGLQCKPKRLRQLPFEFCPVSAVHLSAPANWTGGIARMFIENFTRR
jgi:hypothetical protein